MTPIIQLTNVKKSVQDGKRQLQILENCSLSIHEGDMMAVLGRSGSGKTTLLNLIAMLDNNYEGEYFFNHINMTILSNKERFALRTRSIGYIFQDFQLIDAFNVLQNVEIPLGYQGIQRHKRIERSLKAIEEVGLSDRCKSIVGTLSGGEKQRVCIARASAST